MRTPQELSNLIIKVVVKPVGRDFTVLAILKNGSDITLKAKTRMIPKAVQLYSRRANCNSKIGTSAQYFTFNKKIDVFGGYMEHLNTYQVELA